MRMPFGKHRGMDLDDIEDSYLLWCLANIENMNPFLKEAIQERLGLNRSKPPPPPPPPRQPPPPPAGVIAKDELDSKVKQWFRSVAMDYHPDRRRGNSEAMTALNDAHDRLRKTLAI